MDVRRLDEMQAQGRSIFDTELAVAYYARVSTDKDEQINSLGNQKRYFEDYITANPHWTFAGGYVDEGISGTSVEGREQFLKMIEDAKRGRFDLIVTKEISRFARNTLDSLRYTRELLRCGVGVYFQNDNINTFDKDAELRLTIMSSIAQDEVRKLSERTRFGFKRAQENSVLLGQNNLFGYNKVDGRLEIVEPEAAVVREVFERYAAGDLGLRAFAAQQDNAPALAQVEQEIETVTRRKDKLLDLALAGALSNDEFKQRNETCNEQLAALEQQRTELQNADKTLEERIRRVENLRRIIEERWQTNCGFSREMSKALVDHIVVDADESKTRISLDIFLTTGAEPIVSETQTSNSQLQMSFQRTRSGYQGTYEVRYCVRWYLG